MKKIIGLIVAIVLLSTVAFAAEINIEDAKLTAQAALPEGAVFLGSEYDDGALELKYWVDEKQEMFEITFAADASISKIDSESWNDNGSATVKLTEEEAAAVVAGEYEGAVIETTLLSSDDGMYEYDVYFMTETLYGIVTVNPESGAIMEREIFIGTKAVDPSATGAPVNGGTSGGASGGTSGGTSGAITEAKAKELVLARITDGEIVKFETDYDDGRKEYEGEARDGSYEYDFTIDAATGRFLEWERERLTSSRTTAPASAPTTAPTSGDSTGGGSSGGDTSGNLIGTSKAKSIAVEKAGGGTVTSIKLDYDDGKAVYEGKVVTSSYEYEFEIDAETGKVREWDRERIERDDRDDRDDDDDDRDDRDDDDDDDD